MPSLAWSDRWLLSDAQAERCATTHHRAGRDDGRPVGALLLVAGSVPALGGGATLAPSSGAAPLAPVALAGTTTVQTGSKRHQSQPPDSGAPAYPEAPPD